MINISYYDFCWHTIDHYFNQYLLIFILFFFQFCFLHKISLIIKMFLSTLMMMMMMIINNSLKEIYKLFLDNVMDRNLNIIDKQMLLQK